MKSYQSGRRGHYRVMNYWNSISSRPYTPANLKPHSFDYIDAQFSPTTSISWWTEPVSRITTTILEPGGDRSQTAIHDKLGVVRSNSFNHAFDVTRVTERAMEKIYDKLRGQSEMLVDLAESRQTVKLVKDVLQLKKRVLKYAAEFVLPDRRSRRERLDDFYTRQRRNSRRKRNSKSTKQRFRAAMDSTSGHWLQYRYGIMPLLYSIYDGADNLRRTATTGTFSVRAASGDRFERDFSESVPQPGYNERTWWSYESRIYVTLNLRFRAPSRSEQEVLNWTSLNPLSIAWELLPLSFVADWIVNVGDQLRAWENHTVFSRHFSGGTKSVYQVEDRQGYYTSGPGGPNIETWPNGEYKNQQAGWRTTCGASVRKAAKSRTVLDSLPRPAGFRVKVNLNASRIADAASLINSNLRRFR